MQTFEMGLSRSISITALGLLATTACDTSRSILAPPPATAVRAALTRDTNHPVKLGAVTFAPNLLMVTAAVAHVECSGTIGKDDTPNINHDWLWLAIHAHRAARFMVFEIQLDSDWSLLH